MYSSRMDLSITVSEARASLPAIIERVLAGEEVILTRHGKAVAVVVRPDALRVRRAGSSLDAAARLHQVIEHGRSAALRRRPAMSQMRADQLLAEVDAGRSRA
jgi:antitoxin (DNA-binding transcriptional repressor) of toxin-antitoxin stability system